MNTTYFLNLVAGHIYRSKTDPALPEKLYVGLSSTEPSPDGTGVTEPPASAGYERIQLTSMSEPVDGSVSNTQPIDFPESTDDWGVMTHFVVYDAPTGGNLLVYNPLDKNRTVESESIMTFKVGALTLSAENSGT